VTRRSALGWLGGAVVLGLVGAGIWMSSRKTSRPPATRPAEAKRPAGPARAGMLALRVDSGRRVELLPGTALVFDVYLAGSKGAAPVTVGRPGAPWHSLVRLVDDSTRRPLAWAVAPLGSPGSVAFSSPAGGLEVSGEAGDVATLDHDHVHHLVLAASPEAMSAAAPGTYGVRAILQGDSRLESAPVEVVVGTAGDSAVRDRLERERVASSAEFYLEARRFEEARRSSEDLTAREPKNPGAWMLLGDALDGLGKPRDALAAYRRALAVSPRTYEEPTLLYRRISAMWRKLAR